MLERGDKPEKGEGIDVEMGGGGGCYFFITLQFNHIYCMWRESKVPFITFQIFSLLSYPVKNLVLFVHFGSILVVYKKC